MAPGMPALPLVAAGAPPPPAAFAAGAGAPALVFITGALLAAAAGGTVPAGAPIATVIVAGLVPVAVLTRVLDDPAAELLLGAAVSRSKLPPESMACGVAHAPKIGSMHTTKLDLIKLSLRGGGVVPCLMSGSVGIRVSGPRKRRLAWNFAGTGPAFVSAPPSREQLTFAVKAVASETKNLR